MKWNFYLRFIDLRKIKELIIMNTQEEFYPKSNCLALTVRKEHRLIVINNLRKATIRVSLKTLFYAFFLTVMSIVV